MRMPVDECMRRVPIRQYRAWVAWQDMEWDRPDRRDFYLMQIACEVKRVLMKEPNAIDVNQFIIPFKNRAVLERAEELAGPPAEDGGGGERDAAAYERDRLRRKAYFPKLQALGRMTANVEVRRISRAEAEANVRQLEEDRRNYGN